MKRSWLALAVALALTAAALAPPPARAGFVGTEAVVSSKLRGELSSLLGRAEVRQELQRLGISPEEAEARLAALSDAEITTLAAQLPAAPAGQGEGQDLLVGLAVGIGSAPLLLLLFAIFVGLFECLSSSC